MIRIFLGGSFLGIYLLLSYLVFPVLWIYEKINKKKKGHYCQFLLEAEQSVWVEIQKIFKITKSVMRYIILNQEG